MKLKDSSINPQSISNELLLAIIVANDVYKKRDVNMVITSLNDSRHSRTSLHYSGNAVDLRTHGINRPSEVVHEIRLGLGMSADYDVILESDHIHIEYQPKRSLA